MLSSDSIEAHRQKWGVGLRTPSSAPIPESLWREIHGNDPHAEAVRWLDSASGGRPLPHTVCVIGAGLGYVVDAITERSESRILVLEPEPSLEPRPLSPAAQAGRAAAMRRQPRGPAARALRRLRYLLD